MTPITKFEGEFSFLSNFSRSKIDLRENDAVYTFPTVEHGYQWLKVTNPLIRKRILTARRPMDAKQLGNLPEAAMRQDWEKELKPGPHKNTLKRIGVPPLVKVQCMLVLLRRKFSQPLRMALLRQVHGRELVEGNTWGDEFWGVCNGRGLNCLGKLEMYLCEEIVKFGGPVDDQYSTAATSAHHAESDSADQTAPNRGKGRAAKR